MITALFGFGLLAAIGFFLFKLYKESYGKSKNDQRKEEIQARLEELSEEEEVLDFNKILAEREAEVQLKKDSQ